MLPSDLAQLRRGTPEILVHRAIPREGCGPGDDERHATRSQSLHAALAWWAPWTRSAGSTIRQPSANGSHHLRLPALSSYLSTISCIYMNPCCRHLGTLIPSHIH